MDLGCKVGAEARPRKSVGGRWGRPAGCRASASPGRGLGRPGLGLHTALCPTQVDPIPPLGSCLPRPHFLPPGTGNIIHHPIHGVSSLSRVTSAAQVLAEELEGSPSWPPASRGPWGHLGALCLGPYPGEGQVLWVPPGGLRLLSCHRPYSRGGWGAEGLCRAQETPVLRAGRPQPGGRGEAGACFPLGLGFCEPRQTFLL